MFQKFGHDYSLIASKIYSMFFFFFLSIFTGELQGKSSPDMLSEDSLPSSFSRTDLKNAFFFLSCALKE